MPRNILINLLSSSHRSTTGGFVYIKSLLPELFALDSVNNYAILLSQDNHHFFKKNHLDRPNVRYIICDVRRDFWANPLRALGKVVARLKKNRGMRERLLEKEVQGIIRKQKIDILFCPASVIYPRGIKDVKIVTTVLDLQHEFMPENFSPEYLKRRIEDSRYYATRSDRLISISEFTKQTLVQKYNVDPAKITTIYFAPQKIEEGDADVALPDEYLFYPAAIWPHKNHKVLIHAFALLAEQFPKLHLVFAGLVKNKELYTELKSIIQNNGLSERVLFLEYIFGAKLARVFRGAKIMVFPSSFEGFGIPLVESFMYGVPVIASDNTSITEIVADAGVLFRSGDTKMLADSITRVLTDDSLRQELIRKGYERAKEFSWQRAAQQTIAVFNGI